jgi:diacylglycerol O-acyltransferase / wax synthase
MVGWAPATLLSLAARVPWRDLPFNMIVTNVPGPQRPVYLLGAKMLADYGLVPIAEYVGLGIVLFSYEGRMTWGFNADWDVVPDLDVFVRCVEDAYSELLQAAQPAQPVFESPTVSPP